jgi:hypothetical protein
MNSTPAAGNAAPNCEVIRSPEMRPRNQCRQPSTVKIGTIFEGRRTAQSSTAIRLELSTTDVNTYKGVRLEPRGRNSLHSFSDVLAQCADEESILLQTVAGFANVAIRKVGISVQGVRVIIDAWGAVLPIEAADEEDLSRENQWAESQPQAQRRKPP